MALWMIPAGMAAFGAFKGASDARAAQQDARDQRNLYAAMARAGYGSNIPGGGFVGTPASAGEGALAGGLGGAQTGLGVMSMAKGLGLFDGDPAPAPEMPYGEQGNMSSYEYNNPYANENFVGPPTPHQAYMQNAVVATPLEPAPAPVVGPGGRLGRI